MNIITAIGLTGAIILLLGILSGIRDYRKEKKNGGEKE